MPNLVSCPAGIILFIKWSMLPCIRMAKWADYLISEVSYDSKRRIKSVLRHKDTGTDVQRPEIVNRVSIIDDLRGGRSYCTIFNGLDTWTLGSKIRLHRIGSQRSIRVDDNKVAFDNLGPVLEMSMELEMEKPEPAIESKVPKVTEAIKDKKPEPAIESKVPKVTEAIKDKKPEPAIESKVPKVTEAIKDKKPEPASLPHTKTDDAPPAVRDLPPKKDQDVPDKKDDKPAKKRQAKKSEPTTRKRKPRTVKAKPEE